MEVERQSPWEGMPFQPALEKAAERKPKWNQGGAERKPKGAKREPKGPKREPNGAQREARGAKREPKGAQREPKGTQRRPKCMPKSTSTPKSMFDAEKALRISPF